MTIKKKIYNKTNMKKTEKKPLYLEWNERKNSYYGSGYITSSTTCDTTRHSSLQNLTASNNLLPQTSDSIFQHNNNALAVPSIHIAKQLSLFQKANINFDASSVTLNNSLEDFEKSLELDLLKPEASESIASLRPFSAVFRWLQSFCSTVWQKYRYTVAGGKKVRKRIVQKNGECNVSVANVAKRRRRYLQDIFTTLVDIKWRWTLSVFAMSFLLSWLGFATMWCLIAYIHGDLMPEHMPQFQTQIGWTPCVINILGFTSCFLFSIETQHTIGYGSRHTTEECPHAIVVMCIQSITGVMIQAFMVGIVFAKLSRPKKRTQTLIFSRNMCILQRDGILCLIFRVGDIRKSHIIEAHVRAQLIRKHVTKEGEEIPLFMYDLDVGYDVGEDRIFFIWPMTIVHKIDERSPLYDLSAEDLKKDEFEVVVLLEGVIESTGMTTQARSSYLPDEILWGHKFEPLVNYKKASREGFCVDLSRFNNTTPVHTPNLSAREIDKLQSESDSSDDDEDGKDRRKKGNVEEADASSVHSSQATSVGPLSPHSADTVAAAPLLSPTSQSNNGSHSADYTNDVHNTSDGACTSNVPKTSDGACTSNVPKTSHSACTSNGPDTPHMSNSTATSNIPNTSNNVCMSRIPDSSHITNRTDTPNSPATPILPGASKTPNNKCSKNSLNCSSNNIRAQTDNFIKGCEDDNQSSKTSNITTNQSLTKITRPNAFTYDGNELQSLAGNSNRRKLSKREYAPNARHSITFPVESLRDYSEKFCIEPETGNASAYRRTISHPNKSCYQQDKENIVDLTSNEYRKNNTLNQEKTERLQSHKDVTGVRSSDNIASSAAGCSLEQTNQDTSSMI
uniref:Inward rectifier potassium channel n=1 Tax=Hirondellea gigas TaxID=1518452 RepID=A0A6A7G0Q8_9CRUS